MESTIIDKLYQDNEELTKYLQEKGEISFQTAVEDGFRKTLLLSCASYFETRLTDSLKDFFHEHSKTADIVLHFITNKAMNRQYHTYFDWKATNANSFFGLFGDNFKQYFKTQVEGDENLSKGIRAFLELGNLRNRLVHQNFASFPLDKTTDEIYAMYQQALLFVEMFPQKLKSYLIDTSSKVDQ